MKTLTSTQVLYSGFAAILALLIYSVFEAARLQGAGEEQQGLAYRRFIRQDDAITAFRRTIWLGGIYSRDFFLNPTPAGRERFSANLEELQRGGAEALATLRQASPSKFAELQVQHNFDEFILELRQLQTSRDEALPAPSTIIEEILLPRRLSLLAKFEDFRAAVRQELVDAQARYDAARAEAARNLLYLLGAALCMGVLVALASLRYAARLERERQRHFETISLAKQELENLSARLLEIQEQERRALSQELHDEVGQTLTALRMELSQVIATVPESVSRERLQRARQLVEGTVEMVRDISLMLRPSLLDDLGLGPALQWQLERFSSRSGIRYIFEGAEVGEQLSDPVKTCVFRIAQETLNNCEKYAQASTLHVVLRHKAGQVSLEVKDDGLGFSLDGRGLPLRGTGILGMKERAQKLGGSLTVDTRPGDGTRVALMLPVEEPMPAEPAGVLERV
jgi:signal transduction histidine kinase